MKLKYHKCQELFDETSNQFRTVIIIETQDGSEIEILNFEKLLSAFVKFDTLGKTQSVADSETYYLYKVDQADTQNQHFHFHFTCLTRTIKTSLQRIKKFLLKNDYVIVNDDYKEMTIEVISPIKNKPIRNQSMLIEKEVKQVISLLYVPIIVLLTAIVMAALTLLIVNG